MDAFCGFVRGTRRKSEELGVFSVEMRAFCTIGEEKLRVSDCYTHGHKNDL